MTVVIHEIKEPIQTGSVAAPQPLPDALPPVPELDSELVPASLRDWVTDQAETLQVPLEFCAVPAIAALGGVIGRQLAIRVKEHANWIEYPILNAALVGRPSTGKSPATRPIMRLLNYLEQRRREQYDRELADYRIEVELQKSAEKVAKAAAEKALKGGDRQGARDYLANASDELQPPAEPRLVVNDVTVEKLGEILNQNRRGVIQFRDELAGWLASLDREGREQDRAFWLETWNGHGPYTCDRIGRGTVRIEAPAVSIIGGIQPGKLAQYVQGAVKGGFSDDGLIQRFQLAIYPDVPRSWRWVDRACSAAAEASVQNVFDRLESLDFGVVEAEGEDPKFLRFESDAQELFIVWMNSLMSRLRAGDEPPFIESHLAKYPALAARLALVLHLADNEAGPVSGEALAAALGWCEFLEAHARRIYSPVIDGGVTAAHRILAHRADLSDRFAVRDIQRKGWAGLDWRDTIAEGLAVLVECGWLDEFEIPTNGRPKVQYRWKATG